MGQIESYTGDQQVEDYVFLHFFSNKAPRYFAQGGPVRKVCKKTVRVFQLFSQQSSQVFRTRRFGEKVAKTLTASLADFLQLANSPQNVRRRLVASGTPKHCF